MSFEVFQTEPPEAEPISLEQAKTHCHVYTDADDDDINQYIAASREMTEKNTRRQLITATWELRACCFPAVGYIELPKPPLQEVTKVEYLDTDGVLQELSPVTDYLVVTKAPIGRVSLRNGKTWPATLDQDGSVIVTYKAGYDDDGATVPKLLKQAILMRVAHWYLNRETTIAGTIIASVPEGAARCDELMKAVGDLNAKWNGASL